MCNNNNSTSVSIKAFNNTNQTVLTNGSLSLLNTEITGGCCNSITVNNNAITIKKAGTYLINVSANLTATVAGTETLQLYNKGVAVPAAIASRTAADATSLENINFSIIINVNSSCNCVNNNALLTLVNTGVGATYANVVINIIKV